MKLTRVALALCLLTAEMACEHKAVRIQTAAAVQSDNSYMDLVAGGRLKIVVPIGKSGGLEEVAGDGTQAGNTIMLSAKSLVGYQTSIYSVDGRRRGRVRLRFDAAQIVRDGRRSALAGPPSLPFPLPSGAEYIRLIYYIRNSESDHNMAIVAARDKAALERFTERVERAPGVCGTEAGVFCAWIPVTVAVRPGE